MQSAVAVWRRQKKEKQLIGLTGIIESWTEIFVAPPKFKQNTPYVVVLVRLDAGSLIYGQFVDYTKEQLVIGQKVKSVLRTAGSVEKEELIEYGVKFKPII